MVKHLVPLEGKSQDRTLTCMWYKSQDRSTKMQLEGVYDIWNALHVIKISKIESWEENPVPFHRAQIASHDVKLCPMAIVDQGVAS